MSKRLQRVNALIKEELGQIILREIEFPKDTLVTITRAETKPNLSESAVFISALPEENEKKVLDILERSIYFLQQKINNRLRMRPIPKIRFLGEKKTGEAGRIEKILEQLKKEKK